MKVRIIFFYLFGRPIYVDLDLSLLLQQSKYTTTVQGQAVHALSAAVQLKYSEYQIKQIAKMYGVEII